MEIGAGSSICRVWLAWLGLAAVVSSPLHIYISIANCITTAAYCSSKGAIAQPTKQVAVDYGKHKIHVNAICPGGKSSIFHLPSYCSLRYRTDVNNQTAIETAMIQPLTENDAAAKTLRAAHPWGAFGETKNIAGAAVFLASEDAAFVTGVLLPVDGGFVAE